MIQFDMTMYEEQRERLEFECREGIARLLHELTYQRSEAHHVVAHTHFTTHASVEGANYILAAMAKWEASVADHRLRAAQMVLNGGPDDYVEQAMFATMELDQFLFWVRRTRAHMMAAQPMQAFQQPMPAYQQPMAAPAAPPAAAGPASDDSGLGADYWKLVRDLQKKEAQAAKSVRDHANSLNKQNTIDRLASASRISAKVRSVL